MSTYKPPTVYTIGHSNRPIEEFTALLGAARIRTLVDVRARPTSTRHPQYNAETLRTALEPVGVIYHWAGRQLGGLREAQAGSPHVALVSDSLRAFADHMETEVFKRGVVQLLTLARQAPTAILCAEKDPQDCHRALIGDYLTLQGVTVLHLVESGETREHTLDSRARRESGRLIYDRQTSGELGL